MLSLVFLPLLLACSEPEANAARAADASGVVSAALADSARQLIPVGTIRVSVMDVAAPPRAQALMARLQAAVRQHPQWWLEYTREHARPGEPLPYHAKFGLPEAEYREMLALLNQLQLAEVGTAELVIRAEGENRFVLDGGTGLPDLTGIVVDLEHGRVETPFGHTSTRNPVPASEEQRATGPWSGMSWKHEALTDGGRSGTLINFNLGRLQESGRGILYYDAKRVVDGTMQNRATRILTYDLPAR
jgi:hypothetical protein